MTKIIREIDFSHLLMVSMTIEHYQSSIRTVTDITSFTQRVHIVF